MYGTTEICMQRGFGEMWGGEEGYNSGSKRRKNLHEVFTECGQGFYECGRQRQNSGKNKCLRNTGRESILLLHSLFNKIFCIFDRTIHLRVSQTKYTK